MKKLSLKQSNFGLFSMEKMKREKKLQLLFVMYIDLFSVLLSLHNYILFTSEIGTQIAVVVFNLVVKIVVKTEDSVVMIVTYTVVFTIDLFVKKIAVLSIAIIEKAFTRTAIGSV